MKNKFISSTIDFLATLLMTAALAGFFGFYFFNSYLDSQTIQEQENAKLLATQQKLLEEAIKDINSLKQNNVPEIVSQIQAEARRQIAQIQQQTADAIAAQQKIIDELKLPTKYTQRNTNLVRTNNTQVIRSVSAGTRVVVISENAEWATVKLGSQEGRIPSQHLADSAPSAIVPDLSVIVRQWRPNMGFINCEFRNADTGKVYMQKTGSGTAFDLNNEISVITNKHVVTDDKGLPPSSCTLKFPGSTRIFSVVSNSIRFSPTFDWGIIRVSDFRNYINTSTISRITRCTSPADGDEVAILGYPGIGSQTDITTTRGIISGRDGNYYITDAKIDVGNSGGAAILIKHNCYLGIPTFVVKGGVESLGRILDAGIVLGN